MPPVKRIHRPRYDGMEKATAYLRLIEDMHAGSRVALSRLLSYVENRRDEAGDVLQPLSASIGNAIRIGFTGPPGAGKSSLVTAYVKLLRRQNRRVGVLAVDPTSPFSGGALLGDRVRMSAIATDAGVFVRSVATRGDLGGLAEAAGDMADVLDAAGFDPVLFETVGVGQSELEIVEYADCTVVVLVPESGDSIQGMKAGLMEIADVFVINKSDREGADRFAADLHAAMNLKQWESWTPPVVMTVAIRDDGLDEFHTQVNRYVEHLRASGELVHRRTERARRRTKKFIEQKVLAGFWTPERMEKMETAIREKQSPFDISRNLLNPAN
jgi:LAO/AO transport system kinase